MAPWHVFVNSDNEKQNVCFFSGGYKKTKY